MRKRRNFILFFLFLTLFRSGIISCAENSPDGADIVVALDGSGDFAKIQDAVNAAPSNNNTPIIIYIKRGLYNTEKLIIPSYKKNITFIGENRDETDISYHIYNCATGLNGRCPAEDASLWSDTLLVTSATLTIQGDGFRAENLTIQNSAGPGSDMSGRAKWAGLRALTDDEALNYTIPKVLGGSDAWDLSRTSGNGMSKDTVSALSKVWVADNGDGTYKNPILHADYSDPDVIRVGDDYYMTASSFNCVPGLPVLHSKDLVSWNLIGYALQKLPSHEISDKPRHGDGVWAPCIRYHDNEFYIYYPDPDRGIFMVKAKDPAGPWSEAVLVKAGKGLIDPSPLWDEDGKAYMIFAFAGSRAGIKSVLVICRMNNEGTIMYDDGAMVFDGHPAHPTVEGPKFYKRNGYYYIFAPAGGVTNGWQMALRSRNIYGPYEEKIILNQGITSINGPHQGAWVDTPGGEDWFIHFQDKDAYGRIVHLQPMKWINDWPVIGADQDSDGVGEPVSSFRKPDVGKIYSPVTPPESDEFNNPAMGLQWQWFVNPLINWGFTGGNLGYYRLNCIPRPENYHNFWDVPNLMLQKFPAKEFMATTALTFNARFDGEETGLVIMGKDYQYISLKRSDGKLFIRVVRCKNAAKGSEEETLYSGEIHESKVFFRVRVADGAICNFSYSIEGTIFSDVGDAFKAAPGLWIGAKIGFFALRDGFINDAGSVDIDWFRIEKN